MEFEENPTNPTGRPVSFERGRGGQAIVSSDVTDDGGHPRGARLSSRLNWRGVVTASPHNAAMSGVIFADGDEWRDLSEDVRRAGRVTVVTRRGTAVLLDLVGRDPRYLRLPLEGGHRMTFFDCGWLPIDGAEVVATPCGLVLDHARFW